MFGMGMGELIIIAIVALLALGPDRLPEAAKKIGETIRGLRRQTTELRKTIEEDTQLGDAMREIRSALNEDPARAKKPEPKKASRPSDGPAPEGEVPSEDLEPTSESDDIVVPVEDAVAMDDPIEDDGAATDGPGTNGTALAAKPLSDYEKYIHNNGTEAAAEKFGTSLEHAEAALKASLERATHNG